LQHRKRAFISVCIKLPRIAKNEENQHHAAFHRRALGVRDMDNEGPIRCFRAYWRGACDSSTIFSRCDQTTRRDRVTHVELPIELDAASGIPLHRQLYDGVRAAILDGRLGPGTRLPSTRALAEALGVSRSTITSSFAQLHSEGYLEATTGSGTFVSLDLPDETTGERSHHDGSPSDASIRLSTYGASLAEAGPLEPPRVAGAIDFRDGRPAFDAFPFAAWRRCIAQSIGADGAWLDYSADPAGDPGLREAIAAYLRRARAVRARAQDVVIVSGSQQAIDIIARVLIGPGDVVALEEPGYLGAQRTFAANGADLRAIPVDADGIRVDLLAGDAAQARLAYVTPSHQFPLGVVLSAERRRGLLAWAESAGAIVVEDDYDSAYRYEGRPIPALAGLDVSGRVVYVGTFSKTMFPALRIGYVVVPPALHGVVLAAKAFSDRQSPILEQRALATFIAEGSFERHLRRMRVLYRARRERLLAALARAFGDDAEVIGDRAGMHLVVRLRGADAAFTARALRAGVALMSTDAHHLHGGVAGEYIFGFAEHDEATIDEGIARLAGVPR
jgi:GntR family transcriptional regulator/MocR family aminotransferase